MTALIEWARFLAGAAFLLGGIAIFVIEMIGVFRFRYVLNRMHAAAMGDTLGLGSCLVGLIVMNGLNFVSLKLFLVIVFLWFSSPVSSHLIARLEVTTDEEGEKHYRRITLDCAGEHGEQTEAAEERGKQPETVEKQKLTEAVEERGKQPETAAEQKQTEAAEERGKQPETAAEQKQSDAAEERGKTSADGSRERKELSGTAAEEQEVQK
ncbi:MAG: monovalent cation/H(+) antiporter subunit G [bacterium]|nr:monovalent cation/H(+) antiporter subunit G [bacterium]